MVVSKCLIRYNKDTEAVIRNLFQTSEDLRIEVTYMQKQRDGDDCGLFAIAAATALAFGVNPAEVTFQQDGMCAHLVKCFEEGHIQLFPTVS